MRKFRCDYNNTIIFLGRGVEHLPKDGQVDFTKVPCPYDFKCQEEKDCEYLEPLRASGRKFDKELGILKKIM